MPGATRPGAGASLLPRSVAERFERLTGKPVREVYGMTECGGVICVDGTATDAASTLTTRITGAGLRESHVHDVMITREAPNYPSAG